jgi:hypothetical protein
VRFSRHAPGGADPLDDGDHAATEATEAQRRAKARLNALGLASLVAELALVGVNAALTIRASAARPDAESFPGATEPAHAIFSR